MVPAGPYDALLLASFGGPEAPEEVMPFLETVTRGRDVPRQRLESVAEHYHRFGGRSPINDQNRALLDALRADFAANGLDLPIYWGNRNWHPFMADAVGLMRDDGVRRALVFATSAWSSYSGCRQYRDDIERACDEVGEGAPALDKLRLFYNHPGFIEPLAARAREATAAAAPDATLVFTAHSVPVAMAEASDYEGQLLEASRLVAARVPGARPWQLVYQSRSGPLSVPWLEPDVLDHLRDLHDKGVTDVVLVPVGFVSDHMEVKFDLDTEALELADELGMTVVRAATVGTDPAFVAMVRELVLERVEPGRERRSLGDRGPWPDGCRGSECCRFTPGR